jgi:hypothetical protein
LALLAILFSSSGLMARSPGVTEWNAKQDRGGFTSLATSWTTLRVQMKADGVASSKARRQKLYKEFISEASIHDCQR